MAMIRRVTMQMVKDIVCGINPPRDLTGIAQRLGFTRTNPLNELLSLPDKDAPYGYEIVWRPTILRKEGQKSDISEV